MLLFTASSARLVLPERIPACKVTASPPSAVQDHRRESDEDHWRNCPNQSSCPRCWFEAGMSGMLRKGASSFQHPRDLAGWSERFQFVHPTSGTRTWLVARPMSWGPSWSAGCWVCCHFEPPKYRSSFGRLEVSAKKLRCSSSRQGFVFL